MSSSKLSKETTIGGTTIKSSKIEKLRGVSIDSELHFENPISNICGKVSRKLSALGSIAGYKTLEKRRMLFKALIES